MTETLAGDPAFVLSVLDDEIQKKVIRLVTSDLSSDEILAKLLELVHDD